MSPIHRRPPIMTGAVWGSRAGCLMPAMLAVATLMVAALAGHRVHRFEAAR